MTQITCDHVEWAVVGRLRLMLEEPPHETFNVTQAYSLFTTILCWVMQRARIATHEIDSPDDRSAHKLFKALSGAEIADDPLRVHAASRIVKIGPHTVPVPAPRGFETHTVDRFLINLRDATAHGDARNVSPFNVDVGSEQLLAGFRFVCVEFKDPKDRRKKTWEGEITLLEGDMRRIGVALANRYCDALRRRKSYRGDSHFGSDAASIREGAA
jgi:hypothetical protein